MLAADSRRVAAAVTDRFGLYGIDRQEPGVYRLRPLVDVTAVGDAPPEREIRVVDDFPFGQDLTIVAPGRVSGEG